MPLLQQVIDAHHFAELLAEERLCPRGEERADLRAGIAACAAAAPWSKRRLKPADFMPHFGGPRDERQSAEQMIALARALARK